MHPDAYPILSSAARAELRIKDSRFLALAYPVRSEDRAADVRAELARTHPDASHLCWALRLGPPGETLCRQDDAGEPAGSAGAPIARALESAGLWDLLCVVIRWFGGTKLGVGGLIRAYGQAARAALAEARTGERLARIEMSGSFPYELESALRQHLERLAGVLLAGDYGEQVSWRLALPPSAVPDFEAAVRDLSRGRCTFRLVGESDADSSGP